MPARFGSREGTAPTRDPEAKAPLATSTAPVALQQSRILQTSPYSHLHKLDCQKFTAARFQNPVLNRPCPVLNRRCPVLFRRCPVLFRPRQPTVRVRSGVNFAQRFDVDVGVDSRRFHAFVAEHLMLAAARTPSEHVAALLSISLRSVPAHTGCRHRRDAYRWRVLIDHSCHRLSRIWQSASGKKRSRLRRCSSFDAAIPDGRSFLSTS